MGLLSLWAWGHLGFWFVTACFVFQNVFAFLVLALFWEVFELAVPNTFTTEPWDNKGMDMVVNCVGFGIGLGVRKLGLHFWSQKHTKDEKQNAFIYEP